MDRLITDALQFSKAGRREMRLEPTDAAALLVGIIQSYPSMQPPKALIGLEGKIPRVLGNEAGLTQCFSNLLDNAVKFVQPGKVPEVRVRAETREAFVRLWFEDNGIGIPKQAQGKLFLMFQRATTEFEGTGVGLALVKKVAERMGGKVGVESEPGKGSRFWLDLRPVP
jgi:signal transduction histidine kinase